MHNFTVKNVIMILTCPLSDLIGNTIEMQSNIIEEGILEVKTECYAKDKVKSLPFFRSF